MTTNEQYVEKRLKEAARTLRQLPEAKIQGYFNTWPAITREPLEVLQMERTPVRMTPSAIDTSEMDEVLFVWLKWLDADERKLVWQRAERTPWKVICARLGCDRTTAWRKYRLCLARISGRLR